MKFKYKALEIRQSKKDKVKTVIWRPILPIFIISDKKIVGYEAIVDSGADYNIFHSEIADVLEINYLDGKKKYLFGIGNQKIEGYECIIELKLQGFDKFKTKVIFSNHMPPNSFGVLGNKGFFDNFDIYFKYSQKLMLINKSDNLSN